MRGTSLRPSVERDVRGQREGDVERALVELGQELRAQARQHHDARRPAARHAPPSSTTGRAAAPSASVGSYARLRPAQHRRLAVAERLAVGERREHRHQRHREEQRADQRRDHGVRHRREDAALHPLQHEDGQVGGDDDEQREHRRPHHRRVAARSMRSSRSSRARPGSSPDGERARTMLSMITTPPSTMMPKSTAPMLSRFGAHAAQLEVDERRQQRERDQRARRSAPRADRAGRRTARA